MSKFPKVEQDIYSFLFDDCDKGGDEVTFKQIKNYPKSHRSNSYQFFQDIKKDSFQYCLDNGFFDPNSHQFAKSFGNVYLWTGFGLSIGWVFFGCPLRYDFSSHFDSNPNRFFSVLVGDSGNFFPCLSNHVFRKKNR